MFMYKEKMKYVFSALSGKNCVSPLLCSCIENIENVKTPWACEHLAHLIIES